MIKMGHSMTSFTISAHFKSHERLFLREATLLLRIIIIIITNSVLSVLVFGPLAST